MIDLKRFADLDYYLAAENSSYLYLYLIFFLFILVLAFFARTYLRRKEDFPAYKSFQMQFFYIYLFVGTMGIGATFLRYEKIPGFEPRFILFSLIGLLLFANMWLALYYFRWTKKDLYKFHDKARKDKWLKKNKNNTQKNR